MLEFTDTSWPTVFSGKLTVTDGWGRTITKDIYGANGKLSPPPRPKVSSSCSSKPVKSAIAPWRRMFMRGRQWNQRNPAGT